MATSSCQMLLACSPDKELQIVKKALSQSKATSFHLTTVANVKELRAQLKQGWNGLVLMSENFSRRPLAELLEDFSNSYAMPPVLLLLNASDPGHRAIAYQRGAYAWFTLNDFKTDRVGEFIVAVEKRAELDRVSYEEISTYKSVLDSLGDGVGIVDTTKRLTFANEALARMTGMSAEMLVGLRPEDVLPPHEQKVVLKQFERSMQGKTGSLELNLQRPDGEVRKLALTATPRFSSKNKFEGLAFVAHDITAMSRASHQTKTQLELAKLLSVTNDPKLALDRALEVSMDIGGYHAGAIYLNQDSDHFVLLRQEGLKEAPAKIEVSPELSSLLKESGILHHVENRTCPTELEELCKVDSIMVPIKQGDYAAAFLVLKGVPLGHLKEDQTRSLSSLASVVANSLGRIYADDNLQRTAQYLQGVVNSQDDMVVRIDKDGYYTFANDAFCRMFDKPRGELIGKRFIPPVHPKDYRRTLRAVTNIYRPPHRVSVSHRVRIKGEWRWLSWENAAILDENGKVSEIQGVCRDITSQEKVRRALQASEAKLRAIFNSTLQAFVLFDTQTRIMALNRLAQWDREQTVGSVMQEGVSVLDYALPEEMERFSDSVKRVLRGETIKYESRTEFLSGEIRWFEIQLIPVHDDYGGIIGGLLTTIDINDRKLAQQAVERSEQRFRSLVQNASDLISIFTADAKMIYQTVSVERVLGYQLDEMLGKSIFDAIHPEDLDEVVNRFQETLRNPGTGVPIEFRIKHKEGHWVYLESIASNRLDDPNVEGVVLTSRDITERRRSEQQLRLLATAIGNAEEAVVITDAELEKPGPRIVFVNEGFSRISGYAPREVLGKTPRILQGPKTNREMLKLLKKDLAAGKSFVGETVNYRKDNTEYTVEWRISPVFDASGRVTHYVSIQRDITDRKAAEERVKKTAEELAQRNEQLEVAKREAERSRVAVEHAAEELRQAYEDAAVARRIAEEANEAKSQFLASMSHEIRTPLTAILGFARLLNDQDADDETRSFVSQILSAGDHLLSLINDILDLSRIEAGRLTIEPEEVDIRQLTNEVATLYRPLAERKHLRLSVDLGKLPGGVVVDRARLRQVMTNLVANSIKFTETGGVTIHVRISDAQDGIQIEVEDSGRGIPQDLGKQVFEPFYQVAEPQRPKLEGTGLGLAISKRIIEAMKGTISFQSKVGEGTTFTLVVPCEFVELAIPDVEQVKRVQQVDSSNSLRVLVADDHPPNRTLIKHVLTSRGHEVVLAEDGQEAVDLYMEQAFDVLVLDVQMPRMDGHQAIRMIRATPGGDRIPILTLTAYAMRGDRERNLAAGADDYVAKPFDPGNLADKIEQLGRGGSEPAMRQSVDPEMEALRLEYLEDLVARTTTLLEQEQPADEMRLYGHRVAGSGGTFGYEVLTILGRKLEAFASDEDNYQWDPAKKLVEKILGIAQEKLQDLNQA